MKIREIINEAVLDPKVDILDEIEQAIDGANRDYEQFLEKNNDQDDIEYLAELIEDYIESDIPIEVHVNPAKRSNPNEWISAEAGVDDTGEFINLILHSDNLVGKWGPKTFKNLVMQAMAHETIHLQQYDRIGHDKLKDLISGHQRGTQAMKSVPIDKQQAVWMRHYLSDPHEIMAYAHNIASEIQELGNPEEVIRNINKYTDDVPSYALYRRIFDKDSKIIKQLLKYTAGYLGR